ncbi:MAG: OB-fold nucleic acid binding domain-containing protein [Butyricicoccus sp.]
MSSPPSSSKDENGSMMAYVTVEDDTAAIELVVFPKALQQCGAYLTADSAVLLTGRIDAREEEAPKVLLNEGAAAERGRGKRAHDCGEKPAASVF